MMDEFIKLLDPDLEYIDHNLIDATFYFSVCSIKGRVECPFCGSQSSSVHSWYERSFCDLPIQGKPVVIQLHTRRMFCDNPECCQNK